MYCIVLCCGGLNYTQPWSFWNIFWEFLDRNGQLEYLLKIFKYAHTYRCKKKMRNPYIDLNKSRACVDFIRYECFARLSWRIRCDTTAVVINFNTHAHNKTKLKFVIRHYVSIWLCGTTFLKKTSRLFIVSILYYSTKVQSAQNPNENEQQKEVLFMFWYTECSHHNRTNTWAHGKHAQ